MPQTHQLLLFFVEGPRHLIGPFLGLLARPHLFQKLSLALAGPERKRPEINEDTRTRLREEKMGEI